MQLEAPSRGITILSVSELNGRLRSTLDETFPSVWVAGEISSLRSPASGHLYFRLKDAKAQIAAVLFRSNLRRVKFRPRDGMAVLVRGRVSLYDARGDLQIYIEAMEPEGVGSAQLALQQLKEKLAAEGLFAAERKRPLPVWPHTVGIVTALSGAAIHDIVTTLRARMPQIRILVRPVSVQGKQAGGEIAAALSDLQAHGEADVVIVGRGGGSIEDLGAFNEERVVRAIARCTVPIVSAVGHEIDVTLADLVADVRVATPTAAAAVVVPDLRESRAGLVRTFDALVVAVESVVARHRDRVAGVGRRVRDPRERIRAQRLRIDEFGERARRAIEAMVRLSRERSRRGAERLHALSPLAVLQRGYAIARTAGDGTVVRSAGDVAAGQRLDLLFARGRATVRVEDTYD